ncbi:hypothetical protein BURPS1710A_A1973 [Burkholderia pseudomallei 1710a]|uniref:Uncharacterized protein n=1 Tax=Burkholderia pseudomallei 1710a TaxID=320371 RepID=A0A0E1VQJ1_BURPE|nr:hypothetical protein BURPS1710A_A1973 [Burkholderia pseudomallei 1710a]
MPARARRASAGAGDRMFCLVGFSFDSRRIHETINIVVAER